MVVLSIIAAYGIYRVSDLCIYSTLSCSFDFGERPAGLPVATPRQRLVCVPWDLHRPDVLYSIAWTGTHLSSN